MIEEGSTETDPEVLLVDDEEADAELARLALAASGRGTKLSHVTNGQAALKYLRNEPPYERAARPKLVLLDLHMPVMNGLQTLREMRKSPDLEEIPVVVMTSSDREEDIAGVMALRATDYVRKPLELAEYRYVVDRLESDWLHDGDC